MKLSRLNVIALIFAFLLGTPGRMTAADYTNDGGIHFEQRNGQTLPLGLTFFDEEGRERKLAEFFGHEPIVMIFGYFRCTQLCSVVSDATIDALRPLRPEKVGAFGLLYISIDPTDTPTGAHEAKDRDVRRFGRPKAEKNWHYLTGSPAAIEQLTRAAGFGYRYDSNSKQYAHPSGFLVLTTGGIISRYFLGVDFPEKDLASAMRRAAEGKAGPTAFDLLLLCFHGEGISGKYGLLIWRCLEVATASTVIGLASLIGYMLWMEKYPRLAERGAP